MSRTISILIVAFNEARWISKVKEALDRLERPNGVSLETVLIDGGSRDGTVAAARACGFDRIVELPGASIPVCRNAGLKAAQGEWIAFVDADVELASDWLMHAAPLLERNDKIILGWPARPPDPMTWVQAAWFFHWTSKNRKLTTWHGAEVVREQGFRLVTTRNLVLTRPTADHLEGFNEELPTGEDTDFAFRADQAGIPVIGLPALRAVHYGEPATLGAFFKQQLWHANKRSYEHIKKLSGGKVGGNAPRFTALFVSFLALAAAGILGALLTGHYLLLTLLAPLLALIAGPALLISRRGGTLRHVPALCVLYAAYGLARSIDQLGWHGEKPSWKAPAK